MNNESNSNSNKESELSQADTFAIVALATLQGLALWLITKAAENKVWIFDTFFCTLAGYALVLLGPIAFQLMLTSERRKHTVFISVVIGIVFSLATIYLGWQATADDVMFAHSAVTAGSIALVWSWFITLAFCQNALVTNHSNPLALISYARENYARLYYFAWRNALTILLALLFTGISWLLLYFWGALFKVIGVTFFSTLFSEQWFVFTATGFLIGIGIVIGRTQERTVEVSHLIVLSLLKWLLPVLCLILLGFMISLPLTGFTTLFKADVWSPVGLLMWGMLLFVLFYNGVYRDGRQEQAYPPTIHKLLMVTLLLVPILAALSLFGLWLRVSEYGWTVDKVWAAIVALLLSLHVFGYAIGVVFTRGNIMRGLGSVNVVFALLTVVIVLLTNSPILDPMKLSANSQMQRLQENRVDSIQFEYSYLRRHLGKAGDEALKHLSVITGRDDEQTIRERALSALKMKSWRSREKPDEENILLSLSKIKWLPSDEHRQAGFVSHMATIHLQNWNLDPCTSSSFACRFIAIDLNNDGNREYMLALQKSECRWISDVYTNSDGKWKRIGGAGSANKCDNEASDADWSAPIRSVAPEWQDFMIGDMRFQIRQSPKF